MAVVSRDWISDSLAAGELQDCARCVPAEEVTFNAMYDLTQDSL